MWKGKEPERPFVIFTQPSLFDSTRAPAGQHTAWAYCRVPNGSTVDMTERIDRQIERFAPGFRNQVLARSVRGPLDLEAYNPNLVGGDIGGRAYNRLQGLGQPMLKLNPYRLGKDIFLCSSATPPGAGVHGLCGYLAARAALRHLEEQSQPGTSTRLLGRSGAS